MKAAERVAEVVRAMSDRELRQFVHRAEAYGVSGATEILDAANPRRHVEAQQAKKRHARRDERLTAEALIYRADPNDCDLSCHCWGPNPQMEVVPIESEEAA